jgi:hypothetical protein
MTRDPEEYLLSLASRCIRRVLDTDNGLVVTAGQQGIAEVFAAADALVAVADFERETAERIKASVMRQIHGHFLALGLADRVELSLEPSTQAEIKERPGDTDETPP